MASSAINDVRRIREKLSEYSEKVEDLDKTEWIAEYSESFKDMGRRRGFVQCSDDLLAENGEIPKTILVGKKSYLTT